MAYLSIYPIQYDADAFRWDFPLKVTNNKSPWEKLGVAIIQEPFTRQFTKDQRDKLGGLAEGYYTNPFSGNCIIKIHRKDTTKQQCSRICILRFFS